MKTKDIQKYTVLIVDDEVNNVKLLRSILQDKYDIRVAITGSEALERARVSPQPDLILLDVMMPDIDGYEVCRRFKADPDIADIPVIFISAMSSVSDEMEGFQVGAVDYILKPISGSIVLSRCATHLALSNQQKDCRKTVELRTEELQKNQVAMIHMLGDAGHYNDTDTGVHIYRMASYCRAIAQAAGWPVADAKLLEQAAPLHDTGKIGIPDAILKAPRKLTEEEWVIMRTHTTIGFSILSQNDTPLFQMASDIALSHHEKWDGSGYPSGLAGTDISVTSRIVAIADVFDALTMKRPYKEPWSVKKAMDYIAEESGKHFDPELVKVFLSIDDKIVVLKKEWDSRE